MHMSGRVKDLTEQKIGKLTVKEYVGNNKYGTAMWKCQCECGKITTVNGGNLRSRQTISCGSCSHNIDLTGQTIGKWYVIKRAGSEYGKAMWECQCECGTKSRVKAYALLNKKSTACSTTCSQKGRKRLHNKTDHPLYHKYKNMIRRCYNPKSSSFKNYNAAGIKVCERWLESIENFFKDIKNSIGFCPPGKSLDRIDPYGNYEPGNVRWATAKEQSNNQRHIIERNNITKNFYEEQLHPSGTT
jgi:hypothetical protein